MPKIIFAHPLHKSNQGLLTYSDRILEFQFIVLINSFGCDLQFFLKIYLPALFISLYNILIKKKTTPLLDCTITMEFQ